MAASSALWQRVRSEGVQTLAVVGMTKNTGKTVTLNHLLACAHQSRCGVGITSIGRDGEAHDAVFSVPKPPIRVWPGTLVATARDTLARAGVRTRSVCATGIDSPMGEIVLVQALDCGEMEVAGPSRSADLLTLATQLREHGSTLVLLDGALGRSHHASPALADAMVLATGAALGGSIDDVVRKTRERLALLELEAAAPALRAQCAPVLGGGGVGLWDAHGICLFQAPIPSINAAATLMQQAHAAIKTVALGGAVGQRLWSAVLALAQRHGALQLVVHDGTRLFIDAAELAALQRQGGQIYAYQPIRVLGITVNPHPPLGADLDAAALLQAARAALPRYPVLDVVQADPAPTPPPETP